MNNLQFWIYLLILSGSTYLVRAIPFAAVRGKLRNRFVRSFLYYIPFAVLSAMTIPAIFYATGHPLSALFGLIAAVIFALMKKSLTIVAIAACITVYILEWLL